MLIDTHVHLDDDKYAVDREKVIEAAQKSGVEYLINIGTDPDSNVFCLKTVVEYANIYCTLGIHPNYCTGVEEAVFEFIDKNAGQKKVAAIGETGLDYFHKISPKDEQERVFRRLIGLAKKHNLPLVIHSRDASQDTLKIMKSENVQEQGGVLHCFTGDRMMLQECLKMGFYIAVGGAVTYPSAAALREAVKDIPLSRLLLETDSPYLAPQSKRGQRNEPGFLKEIAEKIAEVKGESLETISRWSGTNAGYLFKLGVTKPGKIVYEINGSLYINLTNRCSNHCGFCARNESNMVKGHDLSLIREPGVEEIIKEAGDISRFKEVVFCGFGEPTIRLEALKKISAVFKAKGARIRVDTNGQGNLIHGRNILPELKGLVDAVSVSLNAPTAEKYQKMCSSQFGEAAFNGLKEFIVEAGKYIPEVTATMVTVPGVDVEACRRIVEDDLKVKFRVRQYGRVG